MTTAPTNSIDLLYGSDHPSRSKREALFDIANASAGVVAAALGGSRPTGAGRESDVAPRPVPTFQVIEGRKY